MRLALINSVAGYGSTGKLVSMLAKTEGAESRIYYGRKADTSGCDTVRITNDIGFGAHVLHTFLFDDHAFFSRNETRKLAADLKQFQPDLVHLHNVHGYYLDAELLFDCLRELNVPVIWTLHDCWAFTGHCAHYTSVACEKWKTACVDCPALLHYPPTFNGRNTERNRRRKEKVFTSLRPDQMVIVTPSIWLQKEAQQSFLNRYPILSIPNGIDCSIFQPCESTIRTDYGIQDRFLILASAGNWYKEKGVDDLIALAHQLPDGCALAVVGVKGNLKAKLDLPNVTAVERTESAAQLAEFYSAADVFINLTQEDTFPTVNIEALACGCPVLTYRVGGSPEIAGETCGIAVDPGDLEGMIRAIEAVRDGKTVFSREACSQRGREFSRERMIQAYRLLYNKMIGQER